MNFESDFGLAQALSQKAENLLIHRLKPLHQTGKQVPLRNGTPRRIINVGVVGLELRVVGLLRKLPAAALAFRRVNAAAELPLVLKIVQATSNMPAFRVNWMFVLRPAQAEAGILQEVRLVLAVG